MDDMNWLPWTHKAYKWIADRKGAIIIVGGGVLSAAATYATWVLRSF